MKKLVILGGTLLAFSAGSAQAAAIIFRSDVYQPAPPSYVVTSPAPSYIIQPEPPAYVGGYYHVAPHRFRHHDYDWWYWHNRHERHEHDYDRGERHR